MNQSHRPRKGLILAGGSGSRLYPITHGVSKQLLPVYDKPMIYYPLSTLMLAGIRDVLVITTPNDAQVFRHLLGDGSQWGMNLSYAIQPRPEGLAQAFSVGYQFIGDDNCALILGDNIFYGEGLTYRLKSATKRVEGATVFGYQVSDPERYGVVSFDSQGIAFDISEKPRSPRSKWALTGLYFYDNNVLEIARHIRPSSRGELEITDINSEYLRSGSLNVERLGRGFAWFDTGTCDSLLEAAAYIQTIEKRQGQRIAIPEEIAFQQGWIDLEKVTAMGDKLAKTGYGQYLLKIAREAQLDDEA